MANYPKKIRIQYGSGAVGDPGSTQYPTGRNPGREPDRGYGRPSLGAPPKRAREPRRRHLAPAISLVPTPSAHAISEVRLRRPPTTTSGRSARSCRRCSGGRHARPISSPRCFPAPGSWAACRCPSPISRISMLRLGRATLRSPLWSVWRLRSCCRSSSFSALRTWLGARRNCG